MKDARCSFSQLSPTQRSRAVAAQLVGRHFSARCRCLLHNNGQLSILPRRDRLQPAEICRESDFDRLRPGARSASTVAAVCRSTVVELSSATRSSGDLHWPIGLIGTVRMDSWKLLVRLPWSTCIPEHSNDRQRSKIIIEII